jgi:hypothetical protein
MALPLSVSTQDQVLAAQVRNVLTNGGAWTNVASLTAATGTTGNTISDVTASHVQATLNNNFKVLADKVNELIVLVNRVNA